MINDIGELLKQKRKEKGLTLEQAGKLIGVSKVTYRDYELNNIKSARMNKLDAIAKFLEIPPEKLFDDNDENTKHITPQQFKNEVLFLLNQVEFDDKEKSLFISNLDFICEKKGE